MHCWHLINYYAYHVPIAYQLRYTYKLPIYKMTMTTKKYFSKVTIYTNVPENNFSLSRQH